MRASFLIKTLAVGDQFTTKVVDGSRVQAVEFTKTPEPTGIVQDLLDEGSTSEADHSVASPSKDHVGPYDDKFVTAILKVRYYDGTEEEFDLIANNVSFSLLVEGYKDTEDAALFVEQISHLELQ